ncbi:RloB family protein [Polyangium spumosum]|nr:RloB family protein [Polyangium spumosum]
MGLVQRTIGARSAQLYVVATEDTHAAAQYLHALQENNLVDRSRVRIIVLPTDEGRGAPTHLLERLTEYRSGLDRCLDEDEFWAVFDVDHHRSKELSDFAMRARQKGFDIAGSNPCFELWLLLHETEDTSAVVTHAEDARAATLCEKELRRVLGQYNKKGIDTSRISRETVATAVARSAAMDDGAPWPSQVGTHVHRLVKRLPPPAVHAPSSP